MDRMGSGNNGNFFQTLPTKPLALMSGMAQTEAREIWPFLEQLTELRRHFRPYDQLKEEMKKEPQLQVQVKIMIPKALILQTEQKSRPALGW